MRRFMNCLRAAPLLLLVAGCNQGTVTVTESEPPRRVVVEERGPAVDIDVVVDVEEDDASYVVYREYYDCSDEEISFIPYYRRYYLLDDCDLFFLFFVARHTHRPIDIVIRSYHYDCDRDYDRLIVTHRVDRALFFVSMPGSYHPAGAFDRPYRLYRERGIAKAQFTNVEFRALITLKIGVEYEGARPEQVIERVREYPQAPHRAVLRSRETLGAGGRNAEGQAIKVRAPRPWTMPEPEKQKVRQERKQKAVSREKAFEEKHGERVNETRKREEKPGRDPKDIEREKNPRDPKDVEREKNPRDPKDVEHEKDPRNPKDVEREKNPRDPKDVEREKELERQKQLERERQIERDKEIERQKELERLKELERQKNPPKDPKDPKHPKA